jgi:argininosuccinate lyase
MSDKAWGGRFDQEPSALAAQFSQSVSVDQRLALQDIRGSQAHARMLAANGIISASDGNAIVQGLDEIRTRIERGEMKWDPAREDVHMNVEAELTERIGAAGARLHTARSRNDQVATDMRLWTREACFDTIAKIDQFLSVLCTRAFEHVDVLMPGYTHLQRAQPVRLAHHLLAWGEMLERDRGRLYDAAQRMNECPLGSGALAATTFAIDRAATARELGFARPAQNSLDATGDRDFLVEAVAALANCAVHLSRISEELVLWSSQEFGFVQMSDAFTTGSSMMPQKKNPDMAELVRGKTGRVVGSLVTLIVLLKGLPLAYNRDLQEDKEPVFDAFDTVGASLRVLAGAIDTAAFKADAMRRALREGFLDATEIADYLAAKGVPFRDAHHVAGRLVARAIRSGKVLMELTLAELREENGAFDADLFAALDPETIVERRNIVGGPARAQVRLQIEALRDRLIARGFSLPGVEFA